MQHDQVGTMAAALEPATRPEKRKFTAGISVRIGTSRVRIELCPAEAHGGPPGFFRARAGRRWINGAGGEALFFDRARLADLLANMVFDGFEDAAGAENAAPDIPRKSLVSVKFWHQGAPHSESLRTATPPIRAYDGHYYIGVVTYEAGFLFVPVADVAMRETRARRA